MKKTAFILFLILFNLSYCQVNGYVEYNYTKNLGVEYQTIGVLNFNHDSSYFVELSPNIASEVDSESSEEIVVTKFSIKRPIIFIDYKKDSLFAQQELFRKTYITKEKVPTINWKILDEFKTINKFNCQLATATFRGRIYNVWFTADIPVKFGPWKLQGLPGLILEATDEKNELMFSVRKIIIGTKKEIEKLEVENAIELKKYINLKESIYKEKEKSMSSKMPRNSSFKLNLPDRKTQKEIIYEWEEENKKE